MKNPDDAIERVLTGLRETEAPQRMERRILEAVEVRSSQRRSWTLSTLFTARPWAVAAAAVVVVAFAASLALHRKHESPRDVASVTTQQPAVAVPEQPTRIEEARADRPAPRLVLARLPHERINGAEPEAATDEDSLALSEMLAPSKPAPPLPLTHQEKLLAEAVHHGEPEALASLRPELRAKQMEIAKVEFHDFFEPPSLNPTPVKDNE